MLEPPHQGVDRFARSRLRGILLQPFAESGVQRLVAGLCHQSSLFDYVSVGAQRYIFH